MTNTKEDSKPPAANEGKSASNQQKYTTKFRLKSMVSLFDNEERRDDNDDYFAEQLWCCAFEPDLKDPVNSTTGLIAVASDYQVVFVDCETQKIKSRLDMFNKGEVFYTLAWTYFGYAYENKVETILAAGGFQGCVYLIVPKHKKYYHQFQAHDTSIQALMFCPENKTHLYSADDHGFVFLHDIGTPKGQDLKHDVVKLKIFTGMESAGALGLVMPVIGRDRYLLAASEDGLHCWKLNNDNKLNSLNEPKREHRICTTHFNDTMEGVSFDALKLINDGFVITKQQKDRYIYLWKFSSLIDKINALPPDERSTKDETHTVTIDNFSKLLWSETEEIYLNICGGRSRVFAGDSEGSLWCYNVYPQIKKILRNKAEKLRGDVIKPQYVLSKPKMTMNGKEIEQLSSELKFNNLTNSADMQYIVVATDTNLVAIYESYRAKKD